MSKAIKRLETLLVAAIKVGASHDFINGIENCIAELKRTKEKNKEGGGGK